MGGASLRAVWRLWKHDLIPLRDPDRPRGQADGGHRSAPRGPFPHAGPGRRPRPRSRVARRVARGIARLLERRDYRPESGQIMCFPHTGRPGLLRSRHRRIEGGVQGGGMPKSRWFQLLSVALAVPLSATANARDVSFEERVEALKRLERVRYSHQIEASKPFEEIVTRGAPGTEGSRRAPAERRARIALAHLGDGGDAPRRGRAPEPRLEDARQAPGAPRGARQRSDPDPGDPGAAGARRSTRRATSSRTTIGCTARRGPEPSDCESSSSPASSRSTPGTPIVSSPCSSGPTRARRAIGRRTASRCPMRNTGRHAASSRQRRASSEPCRRTAKGSRSASC